MIVLPNSVALCGPLAVIMCPSFTTFCVVYFTPMLSRNVFSVGKAVAFLPFSIPAIASIVGAMHIAPSITPLLYAVFIR